MTLIVNPNDALAPGWVVEKHFYQTKLPKPRIEIPVLVNRSEKKFTCLYVKGPYGKMVSLLREIKDQFTNDGYQYYLKRPVEADHLQTTPMSRLIGSNNTQWRKAAVSIATVSEVNRVRKDALPKALEDLDEDGMGLRDFSMKFLTVPLEKTI